MRSPNRPALRKFRFRVFSFIIKHRAEKAARNITKKQTMTIPAHNIPAFKPAKVFVNAVKEK